MTKNLLHITHPHLAKEWDTQQNTQSFKKVTTGSNQKAWWICSTCSYNYATKINHRTRVDRTTPSGCPACAGKITLPGINDLATLYPKLTLEWHPTKNLTTTPQQIKPGSHKKAWWFCDKGHEWEAAVRRRAIQKTGCPVCSGNQTHKGYNDVLTSYPHLGTQWHPNNPKPLNTYTAGSEYNALWKCEKGHEWKSNINNRARKGAQCPQCVSGNHASKAEKEIFSYINTLLPNSINNARNIIKKELDIYIPEKNIAIEYNGLYWHSEANGKNKNYHYNKWLECKEKGIQLIQIWEDDWNRNPEQIKQMLSHKLGISLQEKIYSRKTCIKQISKQDAENFLNTNHIQGYVSGSIYLGLLNKTTQELVACMVIKNQSIQNKRILNIMRYATSQNVVGGFTKLLKYIEITHEPDKIITFSDNTVSDGGLYENNGFIADKELPPDYMYVVSSKRVHKFNYRLKRFRNDPQLIWDPNLSESQLAVLNKIPRIWDAGKIRWVKNI